MDLSSLAELGKVAGVAGIAIGMIVLIARPIIDRTSTLPRAERAPMLRLVMIGAFAVGVLGLLAWAVANVQMGTSVKSGDCSITTSGSATGNAVNCGAPPAPAGAKP